MNTISHSIMDLEWVSWTTGSCLLFNTQRTMSPFQERRKEEVKTTQCFSPLNKTSATEYTLGEIVVQWYFIIIAACYSTSSEVK